MKSIIVKIFLMVTLLAIPLAAACGGGTTEEGNNGTVVFAISDAAADMGQVSAMVMTINQIKVHVDGGDWVIVSNGTQTFDLLQLREMNTTQLMLQTQLQTRDYDMVELNVSQVMVTNNTGIHEALMINNRLQLECMLEVQTNTTTTAHFDFIANGSLHETIDGQYVFAPVIAVQTRTQAEVQIRNNSEVDISGGTVRTNAEIGMNISGQMGEGLKIQTSAQLQISAGKVIQVGGQNGNQSGGQTSTASGTLTAVDTIAGTVTIQVSQGHNLELSVTSETEINIGSVISTLAALVVEIGSEVTVTYDASTDVASEITIE